MTRGLQTLFSDAVRAVETRRPDTDLSGLLPEEARLVENAVNGRRWDFASGRTCARQALTDLGFPPAPILSGTHREPLWPEGVVGAITHTDGYAAAAVAPADRAVGVGIDAEPDAPLPDGVRRRIAFDEELTWLDSAPDVGVGHPDRLLFSAKEAVYKVWYPLARRWLGFDDARVEIDAGTRSFRATIAVDGPVRRLDGRYDSIDGVILSAIELQP